MRRPRDLLRQCFFATVVAQIVPCTRCEMGILTSIHINANNTSTPSVSDNALPPPVGTLLEIHFLYLVETNFNSKTSSELLSLSQSQSHQLSLSREEIGTIEKSILHNILNRYEDFWSKEEKGSTIIEIDSSPRDTINTEGFCAPTRDYTNCFLLNGAMSISVVGDLESATERFYNMTKNAMNEQDALSSQDLSFRRYYYIRSTEEENVVHDGHDQLRRESPVMIVLLVLLSIGIFCLTLAVIYLLYIRFCELKRDNQDARASNGEDHDRNQRRRGHQNQDRNRDGRLGISAIEDGTHWLEVKSTSSSASSESSMSASTIPTPKENALPKVVGNTANSVCCSSVSELSILSIQSSESLRSHNGGTAKLEMIEEEAPSMEISVENGESSLCPHSIDEEGAGQEMLGPLIGSSSSLPSHEDDCAFNDDDEEAQLFRSTSVDTPCDNDSADYDNEEGISCSTNQESSFVTTTSQCLDGSYNTPSKRDDTNDSSLIFSTPLSELDSLDSIEGSMKSI